MGDLNYDDTLNRCRELFFNFNTDRKTYFVNRLLLAQIQQAFQDQQFTACKEAFDMLIKSGAINEPGIYPDLLDLVGNGFNIRALTDLDHQLDSAATYSQSV